MPQNFSSAMNLGERPHLTAVNRISVEPGRHEYRFPEHWLLHLYGYNAEMFLNGSPFDIYPGCVTLLPPSTHIESNLRVGGPHFYVHFQLPFPQLENPHEMPFQFDVRGDLYRFEQAFISIGCSFIDRKNQLHADIKLWDLLWELATTRGKPVAIRHPSLEKALQLIDIRLGKEISVSALAREVGISRNQLTRLFQMEKEMTVVGYIRQQRAQRAKYLLENTTMSIRDIAAHVHSPNMQNFSALVKQETGQPPTFWRKSRHFSKSTPAITPFPIVPALITGTAGKGRAETNHASDQA